MTRTFAAAALAVLVVLAAACSSSTDDDAGRGYTLRDRPAKPSDVPEPKPKARIGYTSTCDARHPQVFTGAPSAYRFIATVDLRNSGDRDGTAIVRVEWLLVGAEAVDQVKTVSVPAGGRRRVTFSKPATDDEVLAMSAHGASDRLCRTYAAS